MATLIYIFASTMVFIFLAVIWSKNGWNNAFLKVVFVFLAIMGVIETLSILGYVIEAP